MKPVRIAGWEIGPGRPCFMIAEIGVNHNGNPALAHQLLAKAAEIGVDAVKFQKRTVEDILIRESLEMVYDVPTSMGRTYGEHRQRLELADEVYRRLVATADDRGVVFLASAWDHRSADFLEHLEVRAYKIASADLTNLPLLEHIAHKHRPIFLSTGMSSLDEIDTAVDTIRRYHDDLVLMHCVSTYPAAFDHIHLNCIGALRARYDVLVGYSGHERGIAVSEAAVALGAVAVERHFTLDRTLPGPDHAASLEPPGLMRLVRDIRAIERAMGKPEKRLLDEEVPIRARLAKSVISAIAIPKGTHLTKRHLALKGPGTGFKPNAVAILEDRQAIVDIPADVVIQPEMVGLDDVPVSELAKYIHPRTGSQE